MKNNKRILALLLALVMVMTLFVGCGEEKTAEETSNQDDSTETTATTEPAEVAVKHKNAHGFDSYSVHYYTAEDGTAAYEYMNEDGELVPVTQEEVDAWMELPVATCEGETLTNKDLAVCYQEQYYQFYQAYGFYMMLMMDTSKALDEQSSGEETGTWQDTFIQAGVDMFHRMVAVKNEVEEVGFDTTEAMKLANETIDALKLSATQVGYDDLDKFMSDSMGPGVTFEAYQKVVEMQAVLQSYAEYLKGLETVTDEEIDAYYAEHEEELAEQYPKIDKNVVNVRHILIAPEETAAEDGTTSISDEAWAAAEAEANEIYETWKNGEATEDSFAALATEKTEDPGSAETGGLYEGVYPGQMVTEFNDWCFADDRQVGDTAVVKTDYGYHIMFFTGEGDHIHWRKSVEDMISAQRVSDKLVEIDAKYPMEFYKDSVVIMDKTAPSVPSAEGEEETGLPIVEEHVHTEGDGHVHEE